MSIHIQNQINNYLKQANGLNELDNTLRRAEVKVSFLGTRLILIKGYKSSISIDSLAKKMMSTSKYHSVQDDLKLIQRRAGINISDKLINFYKKSDKLLNNSWKITKILNRIRESFSFFSTTSPRFDTELSRIENCFCEVSKEKLAKDIELIKAKVSGKSDYQMPLSLPSIIKHIIYCKNKIKLRSIKREILSRAWVMEEL